MSFPLEPGSVRRPSVRGGRGEYAAGAASHKVAPQVAGVNWQAAAGRRPGDPGCGLGTACERKFWRKVFRNVPRRSIRSWERRRFGTPGVPAGRDFARKRPICGENGTVRGAAGWGVGRCGLGCLGALYRDDSTDVRGGSRGRMTSRQWLPNLPLTLVGPTPIIPLLSPLNLPLGQLNGSLTSLPCTVVIVCCFYSVDWDTSCPLLVCRNGNCAR